MRRVYGLDLGVKKGIITSVMAGYHRCDITGKGVQIGHKVSHAKNRSRKVWKPNLQTKRVWDGTKYVKMRLSIKALRMVKALRLTPETRREGYEPSEKYQRLEQIFGYEDGQNNADKVKRAIAS